VGAKIAFIIPVYNRAKNLQLVLHALSLQTDPFFSVVVSDDGSTDDPESVVAEYVEQMQVRFSTHEHLGYRVSRVRNNGVRACRRPQALTHYWFIDSDVMLNRLAVENIRPFLEAKPDIVVGGRYDWLPPMIVTKKDLEKRWNKIIRSELPVLDGTAGQDAELIGGRFVVGHKRHLDTRVKVSWTSTTPVPCTGATLSGNLIVPCAAFHAVGGFDEKIEGQGQDCDFGKMLGRAGTQMIFSDAIIGYHLYHYRDTEFCDMSVLKTIAYMKEKFA